MCVRCGSPPWEYGPKEFCFRCYLARKFEDRGLSYYRRRSVRAWNAFVNGMSARYTRILTDEGFAVEALLEPERLVRLAGFSWARGRLKKKILEVIAALDDHAIRKRFS